MTPRAGSIVLARGPRRTVRLEDHRCSVDIFQGVNERVFFKNILCEWSCLDTPSARAGRNLSSDESTFVADGFAVASHTPFVAVENGGFGQVSILAPVPVLGNVSD